MLDFSSERIVTTSVSCYVLHVAAAVAAAVNAAVAVVVAIVVVISIVLLLLLLLLLLLFLVVVQRCVPVWACYVYAGRVYSVLCGLVAGGASAGRSADLMNPELVNRNK